MKLYCATTNQGKLAEFKMAAQRFGHGPLSIEPLARLNEIEPCEENGTTFEENAIAKALYYSRHAPGPLFVDDSGLAVDALGGEPGVYSARYAGANATDEDNNRLLLEKMRRVANRHARFVCVVALAERGDLIRTFEGTVAGELTREPRGSNGFGYDPLFFYPPFNCTLAEVRVNEKMSVSHRGKALQAMLAFCASQSL